MNAPKRLLAGGLILLAFGLAGCSGDTSVTVPEAQDRLEVTAQLARATETQGICYGWALDEGWGNTISEGSNLGPNTAVDTDVRCEKYVRVRATVTYVSESSDWEDSAAVSIDVYPERTGEYEIERGLERFGIDEKAFIDDPSLSISRAALALPLLAAEVGIVEPAPTVSAQPASSTPAPLAGVGSDFWRDRGKYFISGVVLLLVAGLFVVIGFRQKSGARRNKRP